MGKRITSIMMAAVLCIGLFAVVPFSAEAATLQQALDWARSKIGTFYDQDGAYGSQCVDMVRGYYNFFGYSAVSGNANEYATNYVPAGFTRYTIANAPGGLKPGDVFVSTAGDYGHVGIVESVINNNNFTSIEANSTGQNYYHNGTWNHEPVKRVTRTNYYYWGVIRPTLENAGPPTITLTATPSPFGPKIVVTTNGSGMWYTLRNKGNIVSQEPVNSQSNTWDFSKWTLAAGIYTFEAQANSGALASEVKAYTFTVELPTITLAATPNILGPKIVVTTNGAGMWYTLRNKDNVVSQEPVNSQSNTWDFSKWPLAAGTYTFEAQANFGILASEVKAYTFTIGPQSTLTPSVPAPGTPNKTTSTTPSPSPSTPTITASTQPSPIPSYVATPQPSKSTLQTLIDTLYAQYKQNGQLQKPEGVATSTWYSFTVVLASAEDVLNNTAATAIEIQSAYSILQTTSGRVADETEVAALIAVIEETYAKLTEITGTEAANAVLQDLIARYNGLTPTQMDVFAEMDTVGAARGQLEAVYTAVADVLEDVPPLKTLPENSPVPSPTHVSLPGDANLDGTVNINDILLVRDFIFGTKEPTPEQFQSADVDGNGKLDIQDILAIRDIIFGA